MNDNVNDRASVGTLRLSSSATLNGEQEHACLTFDQALARIQKLEAELHSVKMALVEKTSQGQTLYTLVKLQASATAFHAKHIGDLEAMLASLLEPETCKIVLPLRRNN
ncbi:hypothetical protein OH77DRAFT_1592785 [Trametes cingulata]|nr:hypothetical protein OH77DRAFT_1592785 [Trametes cingulata]